jgi:hypothetical protein
VSLSLTSASNLALASDVESASVVSLRPLVRVVVVSSSTEVSVDGRGAKASRLSASDSSVASVEGFDASSTSLSGSGVLPDRTSCSA